MVIDKIIFQELPPHATNVLWIKPNDNGHILSVFNKGKWQPVKFVTLNSDNTVDTSENPQITVRVSAYDVTQAIEKNILPLGTITDTAEVESMYGILKSVGMFEYLEKGGTE